MRFMKDYTENYGKTAGKIWKILEKHGPLSESDVIKKTRLNKNDFFSGIGWLARENKICKIGAKYKLGETNLTDNIGNNAGKVWNALRTTQDIDVSSIAEISQIKIKDAHSALGWLAREDKIQALKGKEIKFKLK